MSAIGVRAVVVVGLGVLAGVAACPAKAPLPPGGRPADPPRPDPHSHAEPTRVAVTHLALALTADFTAHTLSGTAALTLDRQDPTATAVQLDANGLVVSGVVACDTKRALAYVHAPPTPVLGQRLSITLGAATCVEITYATSTDASALLWVEPAGTAGRTLPMLFTQSEAIHARSWIPLQDTPGVRFTYDAVIRVPAGLRPLMSAENPPAAAADGAWHFRMTQPIPSYLMALAIGDYAYRPLGPRAGVYAEPSVVEAAAYEFVEVERMIAAAERLYGPYRWGRYDMLVLPPSFPYGGMENPRLTFLTPTVITGDRALVSLIAHELAHSWSGNLVTNSTWSDKWLNEGFTSYVETRIMEEIRGPEASEVDWYMTAKGLAKRLALQTAPDPDSRLALDVPATRDPEDVTSSYAYDKGSLFLRELERAFGRPAFDAFLRQRFDRHAFRSSDSRVFEVEATAALYAPLPAAERAKKPSLAAWLHAPGVPIALPGPVPPRVARVEQAAEAAATAGTPVDTTGWSTIDWVIFLRALPDDTTLARLQALDAAHHLTTTTNAEIAMHWLPLLVRADATAAAPPITDFLLRVGRMRMVRPLYEAMMKRVSWQPLARSIYQRAAPMYHPLTRESLAKLVTPVTP